MTYIKKQKKEKPILKKVFQKRSVHPQPDVVVEERSVSIKQEQAEPRYLKIQPFRREQASFSEKPSKVVPWLRLCGQWLADAGFEVNGYATVMVMDGLLVIRPAEVEEDEDAGLEA